MKKIAVKFEMPNAGDADLEVPGVGVVHNGDVIEADEDIAKEHPYMKPVVKGGEK